MEENFSFRKIILIVGVIFVFLLIAIYFRKSCNKINLKKIKRKRYEENLGEELNDIKVF
jgi:formiminotetrahydrofolate cyclodeaminase